MPFKIQIDYMPSAPQAPSQVIVCEESLDEDLILESSGEGEDREIQVQFPVPLDADQEEALKALITILYPRSGSRAMDAIDNLIESAFLAGVQFSEEMKADTIRRSLPPIN